MARFTPPPTFTFTTTTTTTSSSTTCSTTKRLAVNFLQPIISFWVLWTKRASNATKKLAMASPKASMAKPKQLLASISNKANNFRHKRKGRNNDDEDEFGDGGLWRRSILMGDKCQPLDFSGVIYYDSDGKRLSELPMKSPRASPMLLNNNLYVNKQD